jgi:hypothetical protein
MTTRAKQDLWLPANRLMLSATLASTLSLVPSSVHVALVDRNNTWDLVPHLVGFNIVTNK